MRDARQLGRYGVTVSEPALDYSRLLARVGEVVEDVRSHSSLRRQLGSFGMTIAALAPDADETSQGQKINSRGPMCSSTSM